jgi:hydrogenase/urease accessory protein HupE
MKWSEAIAVLLIMGVIAVVGNMIGYKEALGKDLTYGQFIADSATGYGIMFAIALLGIACSKYVPGKLPMVFWVSILATLSTVPEVSPWAKQVSYYTGKVDFLAIATPILAFAGLSFGKDIEKFKTMSWRIVVVALAVYTGTFICAAIVAQFLLKYEGVI